MLILVQCEITEWHAKQSHLAQQPPQFKIQLQGQDSSDIITYHRDSVKGPVLHFASKIKYSLSLFT